MEEEINMQEHNINEHENYPTVCATCGSMPCEWIEYGKKALDQANCMYRTNANGGKVDDTNAEVSNNRMRKALYRLFTYLKFGHLGRGNRIPIPECVMKEFRKAFPDAGDEYMGYYEE